MEMTGFFSILGVGIVIGVIARLLVPSMQPIGCFMTIICGIVGAAIGTWIGVQAFINMGVNLGLLPTKGLTLPLMSYGGSAILVNCVGLAIVLRVDWESRKMLRGGKV